jgi:formylglycine-generating enzyme required for sulfatase activity
VFRQAPAPALRGGAWNNTADNARASIRNRNQPDNANNNVGFRVVLSIAGSGVFPVSPQAKRC